MAFFVAVTMICYAPPAALAAGASGTGSGTLAQGCTLYVSPQGAATNSGATPSETITLLSAATQAKAGSVVCILAGTYPLTSAFQPRHSGTPSAWIVFEAYGDGDVNIVWSAPAGASDTNMFHFYSGTFPQGPSYLAFRGLKLDGRNAASNGFFCQGSHHLTFTGNTIANTGSAGIGSVLCDYLISDHNIVYHNGYKGGWSSGISYNSSQWYDRYAGFHNIVSNNIVVGEYDSSSAHTDGNGIAMDLSSRSYDPATANTPPALIVNNVVYGNGGRCIHNYVVTNIWTINNTCYDNGLDLSLGGVSSISSHNASDEYFVNNVVVTWGNMPPFIEQGTVNQNVVFERNLIYGGKNSGIVDTDPTHFKTAAPLFVNPPAFKPNVGGQYATALNPSQLGTGLQLQPGSPAIHVGIDPTLLSGNNPAITSDLKKYIYSDINGKPRQQGGPFDLGAYQH
jgi:serralysin